MAKRVPANLFSLRLRPSKNLVGRLGIWLRPRSVRRARTDATWHMHKLAGKKAYREGGYDEAEKEFVAALKRAEGFGPQDPRLGASLNNLAMVYKQQGKLGKAEIHLKRALRVFEIVKPDHAHVASVLHNLAAIYDAQGKPAAADPLRKRADAILAGGVG
ncbi:MAG: tetratricopeptide repeat protein [Acidiferrobacterales bacterium]